MAEQPKGMFATSLISEKVIAELPAPYKIRALEREDYHKGVLQCLEVLTQIGDVTEKQFNDRYDLINNEAKGTYFFLVIDDGERIVATGALIVEKKLCVHVSTPLLELDTNLSQHPQPRNHRSYRGGLSPQRPTREEARAKYDSSS